MKKWQPPIPAGAFCSPEAIRVNTALPLLGWCYDEVGRDGWLELNLHNVAGSMEVPYHTVKKWWAALKGSAFIAECDERGRSGMKVRMSDDWLDWRILALRETGPDMVPKTESEIETVPEMVPNTDNRDKNGTRTGPDMVPKNLHIRSHIDHKPGREKAQPPPLDFLHEGVTTWKALTGKKNVTPVIAKLIAERITNIPKWERIITCWLQAGYNPNNVSGMVDWYEHPEKVGKANGKHKPDDTRPPLPVYQAPVERPDPQAAAKAIVEARKKENERTT